MRGMTLTRCQFTALVASAGMLAGARAEAAEWSAAAKEFLKKTLSVDAHNHARSLVFGPELNETLATGKR